MARRTPHSDMLRGLQMAHPAIGANPYSTPDPDLTMKYQESSPALQSLTAQGMNPDQNSQGYTQWLQQQANQDLDLQANKVRDQSLQESDPTSRAQGLSDIAMQKMSNWTPFFQALKEVGAGKVGTFGFSQPGERSAYIPKRLV